MSEPRPRVIVAGLGNIFRADDAFGVEVVRRLQSRALTPDIRALDIGIRSVHLAYDLAAAPCETLILVDTVSRGGAPGTLYVIDPDDGGQFAADGHNVTPRELLPLVRALGGDIGRVVLVGCEPDCLDEQVGLSAAVDRSVGSAVDLVMRLANEFLSTTAAELP